MPGQPFGNVENKRCKKDPDPAWGIRNTSQNRQKEVRSSIFQGISSSIIPRFSPIVTAWARSLAPSFASMLAT